MDVNFINLIMDNDSGYGSHCQESNLDCSMESVYRNKLSIKSDFYLNEDTLLENPLIKQNICDQSDCSDSLMNNSKVSEQTESNSFDEADLSGKSLVIPIIPPIIVHRSVLMENCDAISNDSTLESLNVSRESDRSLSETSSSVSSSYLNSSTLKECGNNTKTKNVLSNITNTYDQSGNQFVIKNVFNESNKENMDPAETPKKNYANKMTADVSPDLFAEDESYNLTLTKKKSPIKKVHYNEYYNSKDVKLLKKAQSSLSGVCPPPNLTMCHMTVTEMLSKIEENKHLFWCTELEESVSKSTEPKCLLISSDPDSVHEEWPKILECRYHGIHYNRSKVSENFEHVCSKYGERYVGVETQSTCTIFEPNIPSPLKRKSIKPRRAAKSPGTRLSHLARRRITFSSSNIQAASSASFLGSRSHQLLIDAKKQSNLIKKRSPKRSPKKTPSKSPFKLKKNSPSSSAKKKLAMRFRVVSGELDSIASTSSDSNPSYKRALFQSPLKENTPGPSNISMEKKSTKRALFCSPSKNSPQKKSPLKSLFDNRKRKRSEMDDGNPSKIIRSMSFDSQPTETKSVVNRSLSEMSFSRPNKIEELSEVHKKKLQWSVYEALRLQRIDAQHPQFKVFASVLARVTRRFLPNLKGEGRTTEKMFRIARHHSYAVVKGKTVDEIVNEYLKSRAKILPKPQGYISVEEFNNMRNLASNSNKENIVDDKATIIKSIEKRREQAGSKLTFVNESRIDRIRKVISFDEGDK